MTNFNDFIAGFDPQQHLLYAKGHLVSPDIAKTMFLYGVKGIVFKIVNFENRKLLKEVTSV